MYVVIVKRDSDEHDQGYFTEVYGTYSTLTDALNAQAWIKVIVRNVVSTEIAEYVGMNPQL